MERVLNRQLHKAFEGHIERTDKGDAPDYFCAENVQKIFLAEAKGRTTTVSFKSTEFEKRGGSTNSDNAVSGISA
jgi:hypothetical protein